MQKLTTADGKLIANFREEFEAAEKKRFNLSAMLCSGVYLLIDANEIVLYVGETVCFMDRIGQHKRDGIIPFSRVEAIMEFDLPKRLALETYLLNKYKPPYNRTLGARATVELGKGNGQPKEDFLERINLIDLEFDE